MMSTDAGFDTVTAVLSKSTVHIFHKYFLQQVL